MQHLLRSAPPPKNLYAFEVFSYGLDSKNFTMIPFQNFIFMFFNDHIKIYDIEQQQYLNNSMRAVVHHGIELVLFDNNLVYAYGSGVSSVDFSNFAKKRTLKATPILDAFFNGIKSRGAVVLRKPHNNPSVLEIVSFVGVDSGGNFDNTMSKIDLTSIDTNSTNNSNIITLFKAINNSCEVKHRVGVASVYDPYEGVHKLL